MKVCSFCGKEFHSKDGRVKYCSSDCRVKGYRRNKTEYMKKWRKENPERTRNSRITAYKTQVEKGNVKKSHKRRMNLYRKLWNPSGWVSKSSSLVDKSERFVADLLPSMGFKKVVLLRDITQMFPFDIVAEKENEKYAFNVTLQIKKKIKKELKPLIKILDLNVCVVHVKPDFSYYYFNYLNEKNNHSSCWVDFKKSQ